MSQDSQILVNNYGITEDFAQKLLNFTMNDVEGAIRLLESSEKDVMVIKVKFISGKRMSYGSVMLFYNYQTHIPEFIYCAVSGDVGLSKLKMEGDWREYVVNMMEFMKAKEADHDSSARIEAEILSNENVNYVSTFFIDKDNIDLVNLKRFLISSVSKVMLDDGVVLKFTRSLIDVFKFRNMLSELKVGLKIIPKNNADLIMLVNLKIEPVLAPIGGTDIDRVPPGEEVLVKVMDDRDISKYIQDVLGATDSEGITKAIYGKVVLNKRNEESENNHVSLEFGPGIYGTFKIGSKVRVQTKSKKKEHDPSPSKSSFDDKTMQQIRNVSNFEPMGVGIGAIQKDSITEVPRKTRKASVNSPNSKYKIFGIIVLVAILIIAFILFILLSS